MGPARLADGRMDPETHRLNWIEEYWQGPEDGEHGPTQGDGSSGDRLRQ